MSKAPTRVFKTFRYAVFCNGVDAYVMIEPFTVYGWSEVTVEELIYPFHPKARDDYAAFSFIGEYWYDRVYAGNAVSLGYDYTWIELRWGVRKPGADYIIHKYNFIAYVNSWVHLAKRFTSDREISFFVNSGRVYSASVPSDYLTVLEWNPDTATRPAYYRRFVLGANVNLVEPMKVSYYAFRVYSRALEDWEIEHNFRYPYDPVRRGLEVYLLAHPDYVKDVDGDGVLEWIDLSGKNRHAKMYNAQLVELVKAPARVLARAR
jgi:hypothetical protein